MSVDASPGYRRLWLAQALSMLGSQATFVGLPLFVLTVLRQPSAVGLVTVMETIAALLVLPFAGLVVDRLGCRRTMVLCDLLRAVVLGAAILLISSAQAALPAILVAAVLNSVLSVCYASAAVTSFRFLLPAGKLAPAVSWNQARYAVIGIAGPIMGAAMFTLSPALPFALDACSFLVAAICVATVRIHQPVPANVTEQAGSLLAGWRFVVSFGPLRFMTLSAAVANFVTGGVVLALSVHYTGQGRTADIGFILATCAGANLVGSVVTTWTLRRTRPVVLVSVVHAVLAGSVAAIAFVLGNPILVAALLGLGCVGSPIAQSWAQITLLRLAPPDIVGRAEAAYQALPRLLASFGPLAAAGLLTHFSVAGTVAVFAAGISAVALAAARSSSLRQVPGPGEPQSSGPDCGPLATAVSTDARKGGESAPETHAQS